MHLEIIFEDSDLLVINKPAGVVANKAATVSRETIQDWMAENINNFDKIGKNEWQNLVPEDFTDEFGTPEEIFESREGIVHRLDKETSGALLLAKNPGSLVNLLKQFKDREVTKKYRCLVHGHMVPPKGLIVAPIGRTTRDRKLFGVVTDGRPAETEYLLEEYYPELDYNKLTSNDLVADLKAFKKQAERIYQGFSLVTCWPKTGRTHQIRVHMKYQQHALVGDGQYVGKKRQKLDSQWCPRHFLHASEITFIHPRSGEEMKIKAKLSEDLVSVLNLLSTSEGKNV